MPHTHSAEFAVDPDLPALATPDAFAVAKVLKQIFREVYFDQVNHDLRLREYGGDYDIRPFPLPVSPVDVQDMKVRLRGAVKTARNRDDLTMARRILQAFRLFMFGESLNRQALEELFGEEHKASIEAGIRIGLFVRADGQAIRMNGLSVFSRKLPGGDVVYVLADTPPHFATRLAPQRVYIGADSYELMDRVSRVSQISGYCVEMGSGSGIQLIAALKQHRGINRAIGKERDRRAIHVSLFNAALNGVDARVTVVNSDDDLREALEGHPISFAMTNPPFIAMPDWIDIDPGDQTALCNLMPVRDTAAGFQADLRSLFPDAGWGGADGLEVTRQFVDALRPLLASTSSTIIYSQFAGDSHGPEVIHAWVDAIGGFDFAFEPVESSAHVVKNHVLPADETATSVARLVVAALMVREEPRRVRAAIRTGGPEHALMMRFARRIEESYRRHGITHFHDGFAVLTKQAPDSSL